MNAFDFIPITFILNFALPTFEQDQLFFRKFYNENNPQQSAHVEELRLRRRRMNPNNLFSLTPKNAGVHCKYQIHEGFKIENSPFLWILKPTFYNRGSGIHVFTGLTEMEELMSRYIHGVQVGGVSTPVKNSPEIKKAFRIR